MRKYSESLSAKPLPLGERLERGLGAGATHFNSKLLLFGEYGLMFDAMALSVPFPRFSGFLDFDTGRSHRESTAEIRKFYEHLKSRDTSHQLHFSFDLPSLENDLNKGLFFNSNIPQQYGVGSSGALTAALFSRYAAAFISDDELVPEILKADFALLESYFHGRSSGLDPLISFLNRPFLLDSKKALIQVQPDLAQTGLFVALIDTKTTGATGQLVQYFIDRFNSPEFAMAFERQFIPANNGCIESLLNGNLQNFFMYLDQLIQFQLLHFKRMISGDFHAIITEALKDQVFIKLLGSGGGGFLLVFSDSEKNMNSWVENQKIELLKVI